MTACHVMMVSLIVTTSSSSSETFQREQLRGAAAQSNVQRHADLPVVVFALELDGTFRHAALAGELVVCLIGDGALQGILLGRHGLSTSAWQ